LDAPREGACEKNTVCSGEDAIEGFIIEVTSVLGIVSFDQFAKDTFMFVMRRETSEVRDNPVRGIRIAV